MSPPTVCPRCQRASVLVEVARYFTIKEAGHGTHSAVLWGSHTYVGDHAAALCNTSGCEWRGTVKEAIEAARDTVQSVRGTYKVWVKESERVESGQEA